MEGANKKMIPFEIRRKAVHITWGAFLCFLIYFDLFYVSLWASILILGFFASFILRKYNKSNFSKFIFSFERKEEIKRFPLKGALCFLIGCILSFIFFPKSIAISAIIVLFAGDCVACLYGKYFGRLTIPWSQKKHFDGTIAGIVISSILLLFFVPFWNGVLASSIAIFSESFDFRIKNISLDDNVSIPLIAGLVLLIIA